MTGAAFESEDVRLFHKACREGRTDDVAKSWMPLRNVLDGRSAVTGRTALHEACANGHRGTVETLLKLGVDTRKRTYLGGDTPLHLAVGSEERSLVFLLLRYGCDPNLPNKFGATCFHYAGTRPGIAKLLLRYGGKVSIRDRSGRSPWDYIYEGCPTNKDLNSMMKQAYDMEEKKRSEDALAAIKKEEDTMTARKREEIAIKESKGTGHRSEAAMEYKSWREGRK